MNDAPGPEGAEGRRGVQDGEQQRQENFPPLEISRTIEAVLESGVVRSGPEHHPLFEKFEPEHITQFLDNTHKAEIDERNFRRGGRWIALSLVFLATAVFIFLTVFLLPDYLDIYVEIIKIVLTFLGGMGVGYGVKAYRERREIE